MKTKILNRYLIGWPGLLLLALNCLQPVHAGAEGITMAGAIEQAMNGMHRSDANRARNIYRHPVGTLDFFGLKAGMRVMEIWPGAGWYTEILAPAMRGRGQFVVASYDVKVPDQPDYRYELHQVLSDKIAANPAQYDQVEVVHYSPPQSNDLGQENSLDMVLTFRNLHGWYNNDELAGVLEDFYRTLKPGGVLGVVQHRADDGSDPKVTSKQGYLPEQTVIQAAQAAGFVFEARSDVNANPKDTHQHPEGVWTLPPSLRLGDKDRDHYMSIGESDRMSLRFRKPAQ